MVGIVRPHRSLEDICTTIMETYDKERYTI